MSQRVGPGSGAVPVWKLRRWLPSVLWTTAGLGAAATVSAAGAQPPAPAYTSPVVAQQPAPPPAVPKTAPDGKADPKAADPKAAADPKSDRTIGVNWENAPWQEVLDWYAKETGLILVTNVRPTGSVTIKPPGPSRKFNLSEVTDLLNEAMIPQKFVIIRYNTSFTVWPADLPVEPTRLPRIDRSELPRRGKTEIVLCNVGPFKAISAPDVMPEVEKMLTPGFGRAILLTNANAIQVMDTAGNIARIEKTLEDYEKGGGQAESITHICKYRRAQEMASVLQTLLKDDQTRIEGGAGAPAAPFGPGGFGPGGFGPGGFGSGQFPTPGGGDPRDPRNRGGTTPSGTKTKTVQIVVDGRRNSVLITAPPEKITLAQEIIKEYDKPLTKDDKEIVVAPPEFRTYTVQAGAADVMAKTLQEKNPAVRVSSSPMTNTIIVFATPEEHAEISAQIRGSGMGGDGGSGGVPVTKMIALSNLAPGETAATLGKLFPPSTNGGPILEPQTGSTPGILFRGTQTQLDEVERTIKALDPNAGAPIGNRLNFTLEGGNAGILAEALGNAMQGMKKNPVVVRNLTGRPADLPPVAPRPGVAPAPAPSPGTMPPPMPLPQPLPGGGKTSYRVPDGPYDPRFVLAQIVDPGKQELKPVVITVIGNRLQIECDDPAALQIINDLLRLYVSQGAKADENLFEVIRLKYVGAADAARVISEIFNGPPQQGGGNQQGGGGRGGPQGGGGPGGLLGSLLGGGGPGGLLGSLLGGGAPAGGAAPGRVRVVAETSSNSLVVVKASQLDLLTIRKLLANVIDSGETDSEAIQRTFVIKVNNSEAYDMAAVVKDVYKSALAPSGGGGGQVNPLFPFPIPQPQGGGGNNQRPPALTVGVDDRTNSLVVLCSETLYRDIKDLVEKLDGAAASSGTEVVRVVPITGFDPALVQQLVDAVQGRDPNARLGARPGQGGMQGGGGGIPGFGGGGNPFGGGGNPFGGGALGGFRPGGMGGNPFGGGGFQGGGARPGGGTGGGGARPGGGGGGARPGGGRVAFNGGEGPANFDYRGMDAPPAMSRLIYDPETDPDPWYVTSGVSPAAAAVLQSARRPLPAGIVYAGAQVPAVPAPGVQPPPMPVPGGQPPVMPPPAIQIGPDGGGITAPRGNVTIGTLPDLGVVVIRAGDERDMQIILELLSYLKKTVADRAEPVLRTYVCKYADCNTLAGTLNTVFSKVQVGLSGNVVPAAARQVTGANALSALAGAPSATQNVYIIAQPRTNGLLIAGPKGRFDDIMKEVERLDVPNGPGVRPKAFPLQRASAQTIAQQLQQLYTQRFPSEGPPAMQVRIGFDLNSNTVLVQAAPSDLDDIEALIKQIDLATSPAVSEVKIYRLRNAFADELSGILNQTLTSNVVNPTAQGSYPWFVQTVQGTSAGALGQLAALANGGQGLGLQAGGQQGQGAAAALAALNRPQFNAGGGNGLTAPGLNVTAPTVGASANGAGVSTRTNTLRFQRGNETITSGALSDVHIIPNVRMNSIVVTAPRETIQLIDRLIESMDVTAAASSYVNVFELKRTDAVLLANLVRELFTGQGRTALTPGGQAGAQQAAAQAAGGQTAVRPLLTVSGNPSDGASLVDLRISVDDRTNSLIVAGSLNDLDMIRTLIVRLEAADVQQRMFDIYRLRNAAAADVATNLQTFLTNSLGVINNANMVSAYQRLQRDVQIVAEPVSNTLLISATPQYFAEIKRLIERIDAQPPQVLIQVLIAEVQLNNTEEFGAQVGLQSPVIFGRSVTGVAPGTPGFNFLSTNTALPNAANFNQGVVGFQGINDLGVGRIGTQSVGGLVFSAQSQSFNLLVRALKAQGRINILSRPQVQVIDNQTGFVQVGQDFPVPTSVSQTTNSTLQGIDYRPTGVTMRVTPRVNPDGKVLMRVEPQISAPSSTPVSVGAGSSAFAFNVQTVQTTILAGNGETVVLGGLITNQDTRTQNGIPFFQDIPYVGSLFRYRTHSIARREILIIMTPHIVYNDADGARLLAEESRRMDWCLPDVGRFHGHGLEVMGPAANGANPQPIPGFTNPGGPIPGGFQLGPPGFPANEWVPPGAPPAQGLPPGGFAPGVAPGVVIPPNGFAPGVVVPGPGFTPGPVPLPVPAPFPQPAPQPIPDGMGAGVPVPQYTPVVLPLPPGSPTGVPVGAGYAPTGPYTPAGVIAPVAATVPQQPTAMMPQMPQQPAAPRGPGYTMVAPQQPAPPAPPPPVPVPGRGFAIPQTAAPAPTTPPAREGRSSWNVFGR